MYRGIIIGLILTAAATAQAKDTGIFIDASVGQTSLETDTLNLNQNATGYKGDLGYQFSKYLGVEAGYVDFGDPTDGDKVYRLGEVKVNPTAWQGFATGTLPIGNFDVFSKVGAAVLNSDVSTSKGSISDSEEVLAYGGGLGYNFKSFGVQAEYDSYDSDNFKDLYFVSVGIVIPIKTRFLTN